MALLSACSPQAITTGGGTPLPVASGKQREALPASSAPKGDPTCVGPELVDQGLLWKCNPKVTRGEVMAIPGISGKLVLDELGRALLWWTAGEVALSLDKPVQVEAYPVGWVVPWDALVQAPSRTGATSKTIPIAGTPVGLRVSVSTTDCVGGENTVVMIIDLWFRGNWYSTPETDLVMTSRPCVDRVDAHLLDQFKLMLRQVWSEFSNIVEAAVDDIIANLPQ
ncbi:MAG: hypothetical protein WC775_05640 [Patescibacteria group bacterium]